MVCLLTLALCLGLTWPLRLVAQGTENTTPPRQDPEACDSKLEAACQPLQFGVSAFRRAQFKTAVYHFHNAAAMDPNSVKALLHLGAALSQQDIPGGEGEENVMMGRDAIAAFEAVLKVDPKNTIAMASVAQLYYQMNDFAKRKDYERRRIEIEPANAEPHYWIGVIDWAVCYKKKHQIREKLKLNVPGSTGLLPVLPDEARVEFEAECGSLVDEGLDARKRAIHLKPDAFDVMVYLNLLYREKADLEKDSQALSADLKLADEWQEKGMETRKARQNKPSAIPEATNPQ